MSDPKPLSARQASECENATTSRCRCRCGGRLHGAKRIQPGSFVPFIDDPHLPAFEIQPQLPKGDTHAS